MARRPSNRSRIEQLTDEWEPVLKLAFLEAVGDVAKRAELGRIVERLERGDVAGAIDAVHLDPAAFRALDRGIAAVFDAGGSSTVGALPKLRDPAGGQFVVRWDARNLRAENWLRQHSSTLISRITDDQRSAIRAALSEGMEAGRSPRAVALDLIGRMNPTTGRREGGLVGLSSPQAQYVAQARRELRSGDAEALRNYLNRTRRDRRFDKAVRKAIDEGTTLDVATINRIVGRYSDRLLDLRGETIARTETMAALNQSGIEAMNQAVDSGAVRTDAVTKVWHTARDPKVRDSHAAQDRQSVGLNGLFSNGLAYPGDPAGGAAETANCRCWMETKIDFLAGLGEDRTAREPDGPTQAPGGAPTVGLDPANAAMREEIVEKGRADGKEWMGGVDSRTGKTYAPFTDGKKDAVRISDEMFADIQNGGTSIVLHHNHPRSSSLSSADLMLAGRNRLESIIAHGHNGSMFRASVSTSFGLDRAIIETETAVASAMKKIPKSDRLLQEMALVHETHLVNMVLAKKGLIQYDFAFGEAALKNYSQVANAFEEMSTRIAAKVKL